MDGQPTGSPVRASSMGGVGTNMSPRTWQSAPASKAEPLWRPADGEVAAAQALRSSPPFPAPQRCRAVSLCAVPRPQPSCPHGRVPALVPSCRNQAGRLVVALASLIGSACIGPSGFCQQCRSLWLAIGRQIREYADGGDAVSLRPTVLLKRMQSLCFVWG